jgi:transcriptional regulator GlxA family with amidase domain
MIHVNNPRIAILLFDEVEVLDFAGPLEVFNCVKDVASVIDIDAFTISFRQGPVYCRSNLVVIPNQAADFHVDFNVLLIPGGMGTRKILENPSQLKTIEKLIKKAELVLTVCTGSLVLAKLGLLKNKAATTHHTCFDFLKSLEPTCTVIKNQRFVDEGNIVSAAGISAGIDMALFVVKTYFGEEIMHAVKKEMEYDIPEYFE